MLLDQGHTCGLRGCLGCWGSLSLGCWGGCLFGSHCWQPAIKTHPCVLSQNGYGKVGPRWLALQRHMGELHPKVSYTPTPQPENHPKQKTQEKASWGEGEGGGPAKWQAKARDALILSYVGCAPAPISRTTRATTTALLLAKSCRRHALTLGYASAPADFRPRQQQSVALVAKTAEDALILS